MAALAAAAVGALAMLEETLLTSPVVRQALRVVGPVELEGLFLVRLTELPVVRQPTNALVQAAEAGVSIIVAVMAVLGAVPVEAAAQLLTRFLAAISAVRAIPAVLRRLLLTTPSP
jgi:hypothetical protein